MTAITLGQRIVVLRRRRDMSQRELAEAAGVGVDVIRKLEQGQRQSARLETLTALANALDVPLAELIGKPRGLAVGAENSEVLHLRQAVLGIAPLADVQPPAVEALNAALAELWRLYWAGRYAQLARELPPLINATRAVVGAAGSAEKAAACAVLAELLQLTGSLLAHLAHEDLAHLALHGAGHAAESCGDELLHAAQQATRAWVLSRQGLWTEAEHLAVSTAAAVEPRLSTASLDQVAVWGELLRYAATALARAGRHSEASEMLGLLRTAAARMGSDRPTKYVGMAFGPTVVAMRAVDTAISADKYRQALELAGQVAHPENVPTAIHARYLLNVAWAQMSDWRCPEAVATLRRAEALAPEALPHQTIARTIIAELLPRRRKQRLPGLVALAERAGVAVG